MLVLLSVLRYLTWEGLSYLNEHHFYTNSRIVCGQNKFVIVYVHVGGEQTSCVNK